MYALEFSGWAQCRLPTDPDPSNEPRGVSGYSFALPGEPDLDRVIRFQPGEHVVERPCTQSIGVRVNAGWYLDPMGKSSAERLGAENPLIDANVDLLDDPTFYGRNYVAVNAGYGVVWPFRFCIESRGEGDDRVRIERSVVMDEAHPDRDPLQLPESKLDDYLLTPAFGQSAMVLARTGIVDPYVYRLHRLHEVQALLEKTKQEHPTDIVRIAALEKRIDELKWNDEVNRRTQQIPTKVFCRYTLNSAQATVYAHGHQRDFSPGPWKLEMWFGGWDADALNFFVEGAVILTGIDEDLRA